MSITLPFDDFRNLIAQLPVPDRTAAEAARAAFEKRNASASGGQIGDFAAWYASIAGASRQIMRPQVAIFAGTHGVLRHGISHDPITSTTALVESCGNGTAAICRICQTYDLGLKVFDLALDLPTADITKAPALDERACAATMAFGMEALMDKPDLLCLGSFGAGASTVAATLLAALHSGPAEQWLEGSDADLLEQRTSVVNDVLALHGPHCADPLEALCRIGGREFAALAGAILAAGIERVPVVLHGPAAISAAAVLAAVEPRAIAHCALAERPSNARTGKLASALGLQSIFDSGLDGNSEQPLAGALALVTVKAAAASAT
ncbi:MULTISPECIES: nicotinate-nucleotide--dimethylbenzimidazole phosphoribosyltransferase [Mesorhizobium]|uniref:Nicotinate-nucleotide--dimethylbenzimidazole phosphoribosyltransferase n=1 Tax=Mesorhizobium denitrificans TaxID=2294114 RepID=A0A371X763_9HYPH|nr:MULTISPECIES: nicotinate-nucleotide--dimethylbenzimidazole phosphoribosyltransferase [Mesorhizobium]RFC64884.1 nicotinate-nucleotide--dimethylbenzimidazole phosphoribosyltransferase [Mesorhizobium denitrificans]